MKIISNNIINSELNKDFGNNSSKYLQNNICTRSFHLSWSDLPNNTKSLALVFEDFDAIPVCGFSWIHWVVANIDPNWNQLIENASIEWKNKMIQGKNSWSSPLINKSSDVWGFGGCAPPNADHEYTITLYALNIDKIDLENGFYLNDMYKKIKNHIIDKTTLNFIYKKLEK